MSKKLKFIAYKKIELPILRIAVRGVRFELGSLLKSLTSGVFYVIYIPKQ